MASDRRELVRTSKAGDLITEQQFSDFELELEWKVESGVTAEFSSAPTNQSAIFLTAPDANFR